jgi:hypothetical protein
MVDSSFEDESHTLLTALGEPFAHYTMNEVVPRIGGATPRIKGPRLRPDAGGAAARYRRLPPPVLSTARTWPACHTLRNVGAGRKSSCKVISSLYATL